MSKEFNFGDKVLVTHRGEKKEAVFIAHSGRSRDVQWATVILKSKRGEILEVDLDSMWPNHEPRKVIQISESAVYAEGYLEPVWNTTALCNDGSIWYSIQGENWKRMPDIPQD